MNGIRIAAWFVFCLSAPAAWARLGEPAAAIAERYGAPVQTDQFDSYTRCRYQKNGVQVDVYLAHGLSVMESFVGRGFSVEQADQLVQQVAGGAVPAVPPESARKISQAAGIFSKDEIFWTWTGQGGAVIASYNPIECKLYFFADPATYAQVDKALADVPFSKKAAVRKAAPAAAPDDFDAIFQKQRP